MKPVVGGEPFPFFLFFFRSPGEWAIELPSPSPRWGLKEVEEKEGAGRTLIYHGFHPWLHSAAPRWGAKRKSGNGERKEPALHGYGLAKDEIALVEEGGTVAGARPGLHGLNYHKPLYNVASPCVKLRSGRSLRAPGSALAKRT